MKFKDDQHKDEFVKKVQSNKGKLPDYEIIRELLKKGYTQTQIAEMFGVTRQSVNKLIMRVRKSI